MNSIREQLSDHDYRLTPQRKVILDTLIDRSAEHLTAEDIYLAARRKSPDIGLATVYRTLELFERLAIVRKLEYGGAQNRYEFSPPSSEHYHHHLICLGCGQITEFNEDLLGDVERLIAQKMDFRISDHCLRFFGFCAECGGRERRESDQ